MPTRFKDMAEEEFARQISQRLDEHAARLDRLEARLKAIVRMEQAILRQVEQELEEDTRDA
jgi:hypothetical protein